uniref:Haloacid dehalogenase-like hydrolase domain-containing protein 2 n=4 Tax=Macrostomum lignano TaxID=282301 RepID=A0A1I8HVI6_9PLAT
MFAGVRRILFDLSGTLHIENQLLPGALEALAEAKAAGLAVDFVSNTSKEGRSDLLSRLASLGIEPEPGRLHTSLSVTADAANRLGLRRPLLLLSESAAADFQVEPGGADFDSVVVGLAPDKLNYQDLSRAMRLLLDRPEAPLLAAHRGRYLRSGDGLLRLGPGPFVTALEFACGRSAQAFGKPTPAFFESVLGADAAAPACAVMIGDDAEDDAAGAVRSGLRAILVRTGKYRAGDEARADCEAPPTAVCDTALDAVRLILRDRR